MLTIRLLSRPQVWARCRRPGPARLLVHGRRQSYLLYLRAEDEDAARKQQGQRRGIRRWERGGL
jgi:hypothetical protein